MLLHQKVTYFNEAKSPVFCAKNKTNIHESMQNSRLNTKI